jgi:hypothetical protein
MALVSSINVSVLAAMVSGQYMLLVIRRLTWQRPA